MVLGRSWLAPGRSWEIQEGPGARAWPVWPVWPGTNYPTPPFETATFNPPQNNGKQEDWTTRKREKYHKGTKDHWYHEGELREEYHWRS